MHAGFSCSLPCEWRCLAAHTLQHPEASISTTRTCIAARHLHWFIWQVTSVLLALLQLARLGNGHLELCPNQPLCCTYFRSSCTVLNALLKLASQTAHYLKGAPSWTTFAAVSHNFLIKDIPTLPGWLNGSTTSKYGFVFKAVPERERTRRPRRPGAGWWRVPSTRSCVIASAQTDSRPPTQPAHTLWIPPSCPAAREDTIGTSAHMAPQQYGL